VLGLYLEAEVETTTGLANLLVNSWLTLVNRALRVLFWEIRNQGRQGLSPR